LPSTSCSEIAQEVLARCIAGDVPSFRIDQMPYGGVKDSGLGREGLRYAIEEMTEPKLLVMNLR
jgi:acyl-CoA reductase-like NAD-dependent aldehyde dehydrogenase